MNGILANVLLCQCSSALELFAREASQDWRAVVAEARRGDSQTPQSTPVQKVRQALKALSNREPSRKRHRAVRSRIV